MRIKLDENLSRHLAPELEREGHDASTAAGQGLLGRDDEEIGAAAVEEGRMLFTLDVEFADLRKRPPGSHPGIVLFRPRTMGQAAVGDFVRRFVSGTDLARLSGCVVVVDPGRVRVRRPPGEGEGRGR